MATIRTRFKVLQSLGTPVDAFTIPMIQSVVELAEGLAELASEIEEIKRRV